MQEIEKGVFFYTNENTHESAVRRVLVRAESGDSFTIIPRIGMHYHYLRTRTTT